MAINRAKHARKKGTPIPPDEVPSPEQRRIFLDTFAEDFSVYAARQAAGINRAQLKLLADDPSFVAAMREIQEDNVERVEAALFRGAILRGDKDLIKLALAAKKGEEYGPRANVALNVDVTKLSDEELDALIAKLNKRS